MLYGTLPETATNVDWIESLLAIDVDENEPFDLTGTTIEMTVSKPGGYSPTLTFGTATGEITIPDLGVITWIVPPARMASLCSGTWDVNIIGKRDGFTFPIAQMSLPVKEGKASL